MFYSMSLVGFFLKLNLDSIFYVAQIIQSQFWPQNNEADVVMELKTLIEKYFLHGLSQKIPLPKMYGLSSV